MKFFLRRSIAGALAAIVLCCGCAYNGAKRMTPEESGAIAEQGNAESADRTGKSAAKPWQYADIAMGTVVQQTIYAKDETAAADFSGKAMEMLARLEREEISWRLDTSEVYRANGAAGSKEGVLLSEDMAALLENCQELWERSEGAFDVTLGAVTRLWDIDKWAAGETVEGFLPPAEETLAQALDTCGSQKMLLVWEAPAAEASSAGNPTRLFLPEGTQLDLGAVGKGFAMEKLCSLLAEHPHVTGAVISLGGSILTYGSKPDDSPWRVGIVNPFDTSASIGILTLEGQWCISTSGDYERYVDLDGVRYHHILDPKTGSPAVSDVRGVTVLMKDSLLSDGLSTACYILGPEKGMALAEQYGAEVLFVMADGKLEMSDGMEQYFKRL